MEQQPFESQLALVRSRGQWARQVSRPSADRLPEQFAIFAQFIFYFMFQIALLRQGTAFSRAETSA
jgi:hypothetical protein